MPHILKAKLIRLPQIQRQKRAERVLGKTYAVLHFRAEAASLRLLCEFIVHLLDAKLKIILARLLVTRFVQLANVAKHLESQHLSLVVDRRKSNGQNGGKRRQFACVKFKREAYGRELRPAHEKVAQIALLLCQALDLTFQQVQMVGGKGHHDLFLLRADFLIIRFFYLYF